MVKKLFCLAFFTVGFAELDAQNLLAELKFDKFTIRKISGTTLHDSVFLTLEGNKATTTWERHFVWLRPDSSVRTVPLVLPKDLPIFAVGYTAGEEFYYYPVEVKKQVFLKAYVLNKKTGELSESGAQIPISGNPYGSFVENGKVHLVLAEKNSYQLKVISLVGTSLESEKIFNLTFDLGSLKTSKAIFRREERPFVPSYDFASIVLNKKGDFIWISVDESKNFNEINPQPGAIYKTTVIRLDLNNPENSLVKSFFQTDQVYFSSRILDGRLFRMSMNPGLGAATVDVFEIETAEKIFSRTYTYTSQFAETDHYERNIGNQIEKRRTTTPFQKSSDLAYVAPVSDQSYSLAVGTKYQYKNSSPMLLGAGLGALLASVLAKALVHELSEANYFYGYLYLQINLDGSLNTANGLNFLLKQIDEFEIKEFDKKNTPSIKGYLPTETGVFTLYLPPKSQTLKVYWFGKDQ